MNTSRDVLLRGIVDLVNSSINTPSFTFGIFGEWGSGKTTFMKELREELVRHDSRENRIITFWFNPWKYDKEPDIIIPFIIELINEIKDVLDTRSAGDGIIQSLRAILRSLEFSVFGMKFKSSDALNAEEQFESNLKIRSGRCEIFSHIEKISKALEDNNIILCVMIDDLDRCLPETSLGMLECMKTLFDINRFVFFIGLDARSIQSWIDHKYGSASMISGKDYIEKIIQFPITLPKIDLEIFLRQQDLVDDEYLEKFKDFLPGNPRAVTRLLYDYKANTLMVNDKNLLIVMVILKHIWTKCYNDLMRFGNDFLKELIEFASDDDAYTRNRLLLILRRKNYPSGFGFGDFKEILNEQTRFEAKFVFFEYFSDYIFEYKFKKFINEHVAIASYDVTDYPYASLLNYSEIRRNIWQGG